MPVLADDEAIILRKSISLFQQLFLSLTSINEVFLEERGPFISFVA